MDRILLPAAAKALNCDNYLKIQPRDVRKTFANIGTAAQVDRLYLEAYFGHSAKTTFAKRYADDKLVDHFRLHVIKRIENYLSQILSEDEGIFVPPRIILRPDPLLDIKNW